MITRFSHYSRKVSGPEANYSASDLDILAVVCALREWRCYLEEAIFTIVTDHQPGTYLDVSSCTHTLKRRALWLHVSWYDYTRCYRPERLNVADPLSRTPQQSDHHQPSVVLALQLVRHQQHGVLVRLSVLFALKSSSLARQSSAQDAGQPLLTRGASGLHIPKRGGGEGMVTHPRVTAQTKILPNSRLVRLIRLGPRTMRLLHLALLRNALSSGSKGGMKMIGLCRHLSLITLRCHRTQTDYADKLRTN